MLLLGLLHASVAWAVAWGEATAFARVRSVIPLGSGSQVRVVVESRGCVDSVCRALATFTDNGQEFQVPLAVSAPFVEFGSTELIGFTPSWTRVVTASVSLTDDVDGGMLARTVDEFLKETSDPVFNSTTNSSNPKSLKDPGTPPPPHATNPNATSGLFAGALNILDQQSNCTARRRRRALLQAISSDLTLTKIQTACTEFADAWKELKQMSLDAIKQFNLTKVADESAENDANTVLADCLASSLTAVSSKCLNMTTCAENEVRNIKYDLDLKMSNAYTTELLYLRNMYTRELDQFKASTDFADDWKSMVDDYQTTNAQIGAARDKVEGLLTRVNTSVSALEDQLTATADFYDEILRRHVSLVENTTQQVLNANGAVRRAITVVEGQINALLSCADGAEFITERNRLFMQALLEKAVSASAVWGSLARVLELIHTRADSKASLVRGLFSALQDSIEQGWSPLLTDGGRRPLLLFNETTGAPSWFAVRGSAWVSIRPVPLAVRVGRGSCYQSVAPVLLERRTLWLECNLVPLSIENQQYDSMLQTTLLLGPRGCTGRGCTCVLQRRVEVSTAEDTRLSWLGVTAQAFAAQLGVYNLTLPTPAATGAWLAPAGWTECASGNESGLEAVTNVLRGEFCRPVDGDGTQWDWVRNGYCGRPRPTSGAWGNLTDSLLAALDGLCNGTANSTRALNAVWANARNGLVVRHFTWPFVQRLLDQLNASSAEAKALEAQLGPNCAASPGEYSVMVAKTGGSALGASRLAQRARAAPAPPESEAELSLTFHPALLFWDDLLTSVPIMRRQAAQLRALAQGELPSPTVTSTRRGRRDLTYGPKASRGQVTLNSAGAGVSKAPQLQLQEDEASAALASADLSELWLLGDRRAVASAAVEPGVNGTVERASWVNVYERLLPAQLYFAGYPYCLDKPCPVRATAVDSASGLVRAYRSINASAATIATDANASHPFGSASYSSAPDGLQMYVHDLPQTLLKPMPWLAARAHTPLYLFEPAPPGARAASWLASGDWFADLTPEQRRQYLAQWGGLVRLPLREDGMARFLDSVRNPYAQGVFDPRAADVCLGHFQAPLDVEPAPSAEDLLRQLPDLTDRDRYAWLNSLDPAGAGLRLRDRLCQRTRTAHAGGLCAILERYYVHWPRNGGAVRFYPKRWELELLLRVPFVFNQTVSSRGLEGLRFCPSQLELKQAIGGTQQREVRFAYTTADPTAVGAGCELRVRVAGRLIWARQLQTLVQYQTTAVDVTALSGAVNVTVGCPQSPEVLCLSDRTTQGQLPSLEAVRDNAKILRLQQQSELMPLYRRLGETVSQLSTATLGLAAQVEDAARESILAFSSTAVIKESTNNFLKDMANRSDTLQQEIEDYGAKAKAEFAQIYQDALVHYNELLARIAEGRAKQRQLTDLYSSGVSMLASVDAGIDELQTLSASITTAAQDVVGRLQTALTMRWSVDPGVPPWELAAFLNISTDYCLYQLPTPTSAEVTVHSPCLGHGESVFWFGACAQKEGSCKCDGPLVAGALAAGLMCSAFAAATVFFTWSSVSACLRTECARKCCPGRARKCCACGRGGQDPDGAMSQQAAWLAIFGGLAALLGLILLIVMLTLPQ